MGPLLLATVPRAREREPALLSLPIFVFFIFSLRLLFNDHRALFTELPSHGASVQTYRNRFA
jgi:hypothetical protein